MHLLFNMLPANAQLIRPDLLAKTLYSHNPLFHLSNMNKHRVRNALILIGISLMIACGTYLLNGWFFSSHPFMSRTDATFVEGIFFIFVGFLVLIGSGGVTRTSQKAAMLASAAKAFSNKDAIGPSVFSGETRGNRRAMCGLGWS